MVARDKQTNRILSHIKDKIIRNILNPTFIITPSKKPTASSPISSQFTENLKDCFFCGSSCYKDMEYFLRIDKHTICKYCLIDIFKYFKFDNDEIEEIVKGRMMESLEDGQNRQAK